MAQAAGFDIEVGKTPAGFSVEMHTSAGVLPPQPLVLPFALAALPQSRRDVGDWVKQARVTRLRGSPEQQQAREWGGALFQSLFVGEALAALRASRAALVAGERLYLRLRLPPALATLPWELLYDEHDDQFLALAPDIALVRYAELPQAGTPLAIIGPLRVVAVLASPQSNDYAPIRLDRELRRVETALKMPIERGQIALDVIRGPGTLDQLRARLRQPVHALHIICHGDLDAAGGEGFLVFEDLDGNTELVSAELLRQQLQKQRGQTKLVLLNSCLGALPVGDDPFSSVGAALVRAGVTAVVAMQFEIAEDTAAELTRVFYAELAAGTPVDEALTEARLHLLGRFPAQLDWAIPVLFLRSEDDVVFALAAPSPITTAQPEPVPAEVTPVDPPQPVAAPPLPQAAKPASPLRWLLLAMAAVVVLLIFLLLQPMLLSPPTDLPVAQPSSAVADLPVAQPSSAAPPVPSGRIAYVSRANSEEPFQIYTLDAAGTGEAECVTCFIDTPTDKVHPAWSPDGTQLAFQSSPDSGQPQGIYVLQPSEGTLRSLTAAQSPDARDPAWSPDGQRVVFAATIGGESLLYLAGNAASAPLLLDGSTVAGYNPAWSPDGSKLAFVADTGGNPNIYLLDIGTGSAVRNLVQLTDNQDIDWGPAWSPDGQRVAFYSKRGNVWGISITEVASGSEARLDTGELQGRYPSWSPDGQFITFVAEENSNDEIFIVEAAGGTPRRLTPGTNPGPDDSPSWGHS